MKLVVGWGNVGSEYALARHNWGFLTVDELATRHNTSWKTEGKLYADVTSFQLGDEKVILAKPDTYMNNSGKAVTALMHYYKIEVSDVGCVDD
jgi:PTH1 family peptidyl-tRNA hydrolase